MIKYIGKEFSNVGYMHKHKQIIYNRKINGTKNFKRFRAQRSRGFLFYSAE